ncbi:MAG: alpha/beta fold hydrolase [Armatimonadetes bacterium]|nr:alpha/beta fold hydrolase [Armatimonadota bacterium]
MYDSRPPRADLAAPFEHQGVPEKIACLLLHGFGCSPYTMRTLGDALSERGHACYAPLLPGHGEALEDFNEVAFTDWIEAAEASFDFFRTRHRRVAVLGFSMGGALSLHLATRRDVVALGLLATPVFMGSWVNRIYPVARAVTSALPVVFDVANRAARMRRRHGVHKVLPVHAVGEFLKLLDSVRPRLGEVTCPLLVAQSRSDHTVPPPNAPYICHNVASNFRRLIWMRRAFHVLPVDYGCRRLEGELIRFLAEV